MTCLTFLPHVTKMRGEDTQRGVAKTEKRKKKRRKSRRHQRGRAEEERSGGHHRQHQSRRGGTRHRRMTTEQRETQEQQQRTRRRRRTRQVRSRRRRLPLCSVRGAPEKQQEGSQTAAAVAGIDCTYHMCPWPSLEAATPP